MGRLDSLHCKEEDHAMQERTLAIIKPDGVAKCLIGAVLKRIEQEGLRIVAMKMIKMNKAQAMKFYKVHEGKPFFESVTDFMSSGPCVLMVLQGENAISRYRNLMGATNPKQADEGTLRRDFATDVEKNVVHGSDSPETADFEIKYFFNALEMMGA